MRKEFNATVWVIALAISCAGASVAGEPKPNPVKTCDDVRAYIDADNSMTMDTFRTLMTAGGADLNAGGNHALDMQCKVTAYAKNVIMIQPVLKKDDGNIISVSTQVIDDNGVCKLIHISLTGC